MNRYSPERLEEVGRFLKLNLSKEKDLQEIVEFAAEICNSPTSMITLMDGDAQFVKFNSVLNKNEVGYDINSNQGTTGIQFYEGLPLTSQNSDPIATLCVFDLDGDEISELQEQMLHSLSLQVTRRLEFDMALQILKEQYEESVAATNTFLTYLQSSISCNVLMDKNMAVVAYNHALSDFIFAQHHIIITEGMQIKDYMHPAFVNEFTSCFNKALLGEVTTMERHLQYTTGKICWIISFEPASTISGEIIGVSFNATDITKSVNNKDKLEMQVKAIGKINEVQANQLMQPIDTILTITNEIDHLLGLETVTEFNLLKLAAAELLVKKAEIKDIASIN